MFSKNFVSDIFRISAKKCKADPRFPLPIWNKDVSNVVHTHFSCKNEIYYASPHRNIVFLSTKELFPNPAGKNAEQSPSPQGRS